MTDNGGERRDSGAEDSWFKPSENRYRKQSEYQDPLEDQESAETVFPDSGGYTGLSSSRPPLAEPYPEALGGPPPSGGISYPGAGAAAYQPLTRVPGDPEESVLPGVAGSAQVPLPETAHPEEPRTEQISVVGSWGEDGHSPPLDQAEDDGLRGPDVQDPVAEEDRPWDSGRARGETGELDTNTWSGPVDEGPDATSWDASPSVSDSVGVSDAGVVGSGSWEPGPVDGPAFDGDSDGAASFVGQPWDSGPGVGRDPGVTGPGDVRSDELGGFGETTRSWVDTPGGEYGSESSDGGGWSAASGREEVDELGPASWDEDRHPPSWNEPSSAAPEADEGTDTVGTYQARAGGGSQPSSGWRVDVPGEDDPLGDHGRSWDDEPNGRSWETDASATDGGVPEPWASRREDGDVRADTGTGEPWTVGAGGGTGNTWAFDRNDPRLPDVVREAEERRRDAATGEPTEAEWGGPDTGELSAAVPASDDPLGAIAAMQDRARSRGEDANGAAQAPDGGGSPEADAPGHDREREDDGRAAAGPEEDTEDREYDDGFTPADYGMPERPVRRRRRDPIADDFPGFDDRPLGGEAGDPYPGYDSIDFLADTERGALVTLWSGVASLIPGLGLVFALLTLLVTGPKAKRAIRGSNGQLDGLGLITVGTVFAVIGILVTVISVALWLIL